MSNSATLFLTNTTITRNTALNGGGIFSGRLFNEEGPIELALEGLYLAQKISKDADEAGTVYG